MVLYNSGSKGLSPQECGKKVKIVVAYTDIAALGANVTQSSSNVMSSITDSGQAAYFTVDFKKTANSITYNNKSRVHISDVVVTPTSGALPTVAISENAVSTPQAIRFTITAGSASGGGTMTLLGTAL